MKVHQLGLVILGASVLLACKPMLEGVDVVASASPEIVAGEELIVVFRATAKEACNYSGDFDFCINSEIACFFESLEFEVLPGPD